MTQGLTSLQGCNEKITKARKGRLATKAATRDRQTQNENTAVQGIMCS